MAGYQPKHSAERFASVPLTSDMPTSEDAYGQEKPQSSDGIMAEDHTKKASPIGWTEVFPVIRYLVIIVVIGAPLMVPMILFRHDQQLEDDETTQAKQNRQLIFYVFAWLLTSWLGLWVSFAIASVFPYVFRFVWRYVNPSHAKYWRIFRSLSRPITLVGFLTTTYISFDILIDTNDALAVNQNPQYQDPNYIGWDDVLDDILQQCTLWTAFYFVEKIVIMYISIHYHYRSNLVRISHSKDVQNTLMALYETSTYLYPVGTTEFADEDMLIRNASGVARDERRTRATSYLSRMGVDTYGMTSVFGNFLSANAKSHWFQPGSTYATVERAIANPKSAAALARRIWMSLVELGKEGLTAEDIAEVFGPFRKEEAEAHFKILDENESGDLRLDEMIYTVIEAGQIRHSIYQSMNDIDHCLNTLDWVGLAFLSIIMVFFILVLYVPTIKEIQQTVSFIAIGLSFAVGRTFNHFLSGVVFVFFDHPFDIGDRVEVWNFASTSSQSLVVKRQSLLYTVFRRVDTNTDLQISNERLCQKRIENVTRSDPNRQALSLTMDFRTSFKDIQSLRGELEAFLRDPENKRDYQPDLGLSIVNLHELNKIELRCAFTHKSNWSNEKLRAARSMRFMCALLAAIRKIALSTPGRGGEMRPTYTVMLSDREMADKMAKKAAAAAATTVSTTTDQALRPADAVLDVSGIQRGDEDGARTQQELEEEAKRAARAAKAEAEKQAEWEAMRAISKIPAVAPTRSTAAAEAASSGVDFGGVSRRMSTGMRAKQSSGLGGFFHR